LSGARNPTTTGYIRKRALIAKKSTHEKEKATPTLADDKDLCGFMARGLGLSGLDTAEELLEDPE